MIADPHRVVAELLGPDGRGPNDVGRGQVPTVGGSTLRSARSLALAAVVVRDRIGGRPREENRVGREIDAVGPVARVEHQALLIGQARRRDRGDLKAAQLDAGALGGPECGGIVRRVVRLRELQDSAASRSSPLIPAGVLLVAFDRGFIR